MSFDSFDPNTTPIMMPPPGVIPNFKDPDSISYITRNVTYAFLPLMLAFGLDDATMIAELVVGLPKAGGEGWQAAQIRYGPFGLNLSVVRGVFGVISDFVILLIPMTQVIKLHLPLRKKITILGIFLTGLLYVL
ncbi:hypothetical protein Daesc_009912 [Daldinia eschscholtzii]|uniref:Rhodopsin domain-containing protein n=1 Tax=Daldinia eschscholtzii TaxID=292717 RepID=A0AAX6M6I5_9PEZI